MFRRPVASLCPSHKHCKHHCLVRAGLSDSRSPPHIRVTVPLTHSRYARAVGIVQSNKSPVRLRHLVGFATDWPPIRRHDSVESAAGWARVHLSSCTVHAGTTTTPQLCSTTTITMVRNRMEQPTHQRQKMRRERSQNARNERHLRHSPRRIRYRPLLQRQHTKKLQMHRWKQWRRSSVPP